MYCYAAQRKAWISFNWKRR